MLFIFFTLKLFIGSFGNQDLTFSWDKPSSSWSGVSNTWPAGHIFNRKVKVIFFSFSMQDRFYSLIRPWVNLSLRPLFPIIIIYNANNGSWASKQSCYCFDLKKSLPVMSSVIQPKLPQYSVFQLLENLQS